MADFSSCPKCSRKAKKAFSSNFFPIYKCRKCSENYCEKCNRGQCPECGETSKTTVGKVYAK